MLFRSYQQKVVELKPAMLSLIRSHPFVGMDHEDPYTHFSTFMELCSTMGASNEDVETVYLRDFSFSLAIRQRHGSNHIQTKVSTLGNKWRKNSLQDSFLYPNLSVQNPSLLLFPKGQMDLLMKHGKDSGLCCRGAQTIVLMMLHNYISFTVVETPNKNDS